MGSLTGRVSVVTGGSRGIGAAIAKRLARDGAIVIISYVQKEEAAREVVAEIEAAGGEADAVQADMSDLAQVRTLLAGAKANYGRLDILVNNAGVAEFVPLEQIDEGHYARLLEVNLRGPLFAMQEAARIMETGGRIVNISSGSAEAASPGTSVYSATKAALQVLTKSIAAELGSRQITVNAVSPGITDTDMLKAVIPQEVQQAMIQDTALGRVGTPEDIADVVAFLASDEARWITGQVIRANGGLR